MDSDYNNYNNNGAYHNVPQRSSHPGLATGALIAGILSVILGYCSGYGGIFAGITAVILAIFSKGKGEKMSGKAIAGIITGAVGIIMGLVIIITALQMLKSGGIDDIIQQYKDLLEFYSK